MNKRFSASIGVISLVASSAAYAVFDSCDAFGRLDSTYTLANADSAFGGAVAKDYYGRTIAIGDFNGDGTDDMLVGANGDDTNGGGAGAAFIRFGPLSDGLAVNSSTADVKLYGEGFGDGTGFDVANAGDVDNDGIDDFIIGSYPTSASANAVGVAYVVLGDSGLTGIVDLATQADARIFGTAYGSEFSSVVSGVGDINDDGFADVMVAAPKTAAGGTAFVFYGPVLGDLTAGTDEDLRITSATTNSSLGIGAANVGDINDDGIDDLVLGAPRSSLNGANSGSAFVFFGSATLSGNLLTSSADVTFWGSLYDRGGASIAAAGDVDGDGISDFWIGSKQATSTKRGAVDLILGSASLSGGVLSSVRSTRFLGENSNDLAGSSIAGAADFDGDGEMDVLIGGERADGAVLQTGAAWVMHGPLDGLGDYSLTGADAKIAGSAYKDFVGTAVAVSSDINADGFSDALVGGHYVNVSGQARAGRVVLFLGGDDVADEVPWYADVDVDTYGDAATSISACTQPAGYVANATDCDDTSNLYHPGAAEGCSDPDYNCDGFTGNTDNDGDGFDACQECDDGNSAVNPAASEICGDDLDNDCDGGIDDANAVDALTYYPDADGDAYGDDNLGITACEDPEAFLVATVTVGGDCDDSDVAVSPAAVELCDFFDNNCDGVTDESTALDAGKWYADSDGDTYGDFFVSQFACDQPASYVSNADDCDDDDVAILPGATEVCDFADNDCDGMFYLGGPVEASLSRMSVAGVAAGDRLGEAVGFLGDQDADGDDEVVFGSPLNSEYAAQSGAIYIKRGGIDGGSFDMSTPKVDGSGQWDIKISGTRVGGFFGAAIADGDVNGDGTTDLIVGSYGARVPGFEQGAVYVFYGPVMDGEYVAEDADAIIKGEHVSDQAGYSLAVGDLNGDSVDDIAIGARLAELGGLSNQGAVFLVYGGSLVYDMRLNSTTDPVFWGSVGGAEAGTSLAFEDLNADGNLDIVIGAPKGGTLESGLVNVIYGTGAAMTGTLTADAVFTGESGGDNVGNDVAAAGDVNGDGINDLVIGSRNNAAYLVYGSTSAYSSSGINTAADFIFSGLVNQRAGEDVSGAGDMNGDGFADLLISAHRDNVNGNNSGAAYLVYGAADYAAVANTSGVIALDNTESFGRIESSTFPTYSAANYGSTEGAKLLGLAEGDQLGKPVVGGGDLNGDGTPDVLVGAPRADRSASELDSGTAYAFLGGPYGTDLNSVVATGLQSDYYADADFDTFNDENGTIITTCPMHLPILINDADPASSIPGGALVSSAPPLDDCDDANNTVYPGAPEVNNDGIDRDCDGFDNINIPPTLNVNITPAHPTTASTLTADTTANDADGDPVTLSYVWYVDGAEVVGATTSTLASTYFSKNNVVMVEVTADDGRDTVGPDSDSVTIENAIPTITSCDVSPAAGTVETAFAVTATGLADDDTGDTPVAAFQWQMRTGPIWSAIPGETSNTLDSCDDRRSGSPYDCQAGDQLRVVCTPNDGEEEGEDLASTAFFIDNSPPVVTACVIDQTSADTHDNLTVSASATDADGDTVTFTYSWLKNGTATGVTGSLFTSSNHVHFDVIQVVCTPVDDNSLAGTPVTSNPLTIDNIPPTAPVVDLLPNAPTSEDDLSVTILTASTDDDGDAITYSYAWTADGSPFSNPTYPSTNPNVGAGSTVRDQTWEVTVTPNDSYVNGSSDSDSVLIRNAAPSVASATLTPSSPIATDDVTVAGVSWFDNDGDAEDYLVQWYVNGVAMPAQAPDKYTLNASNIVRGDTIYAELTARDAYTTGNMVTTATITVINGAPSAPTLAITPNPPGETDDLTCNITAASVDPDPDTVTYTYAWYVNAALVPSATTNVLATANTAFGDVVYCTALPNDGIEDGDLGTSPTIAIQDLDAPPAPTVTSLDRYVNDPTLDVTGTCTSGITQCDSVELTCNDGFGPVTYTESCTANAFTFTGVAFTQGTDTSCTAICRDSSSNPSANSNTVIAEYCNNPDTYEDGAGYGDSTSNVIDEWSTLADNGANVTIVGNIVSGDVMDWYVVRTSDDLAADQAALSDSYNTSISFGAGASDYQMFVYQNSPTASQECPTVTGGYDSYSWDVVDSGDAPDHAAAGANQCAPDGTAGVPGNHTLYNVCEDHDTDYYIKVTREFNSDCQHYSLVVSNGL